MVAKTDPFLGLGYGDPKGSDNWNIWMDENIVRLGASINLGVESATTTTPATVVDGQRWLIPAGATGIWSTHIGEIACAVEGTYLYLTPTVGWRVVAKDTGTSYTYRTAAWTVDGDYGTF